MENTIYCSPNSLRLIIGSANREQIRVEDFRQVPLPEGAMINGIITDVGLMTDFLDTVAKEYGITNEALTTNPILSNKTNIVIQVSNIQTKIIEVPPVDENQVREFIRREFTQYEDTQERASDLFDYTILNNIGPNGGVEILAATAGRDLIDDYRRAFVQANYNVGQIGIGVEALIKLAGLIPALTGKTYLLVQTESSRQTISMFLDGTFRLFNGYRLTNEPGSDAWVTEIGQNLASMLQFNRAQRGQSELSETHFAGLSPANLEKLRLDYGYLNVDIQNFDLRGVVSVSERITAARAFDPGTFLFNLGALVKR
ncbi:hypothetical protein FACS1894104_3080 [Actinomycetota bacterium]|nr:hypothetical protein FACS1894104_3080 [Actinomycetota bacterium]